MLPSGWNALLPPRSPHDKPPKEHRFHSIVVGAGYTGLAAARRMAELLPDKEVLVIEASEVGEGSSARNSGFLSPTFYAPQANAYGSADDDAARKLRIVLAGIDSLRTLVKDNNIDCDWDESAPRLVAAATADAEHSLQQSLNSLQKRGLKYLEHGSEALRATLGTAYYRYGYETEIRVLVQPAALIRGLADTLPSNVTLLERSAVEAVEGAGPFQVKTRLGNFTADKVFIANNAHARALGFLKNRMIVVHTYAALTHELEDDELDRLGNLPAWGLLPATRVGTTLRKGLRRLLIRSGYSYEKENDVRNVRSLLTEKYRRRFPAMKCYAFQHVWGGGTGITSNRESYFGELKPGLYISAGCQGAGVARGNIHGRLLAEMACGSQSALLSDRLKLAGPSWIPPEPFCRIGAMIKMAWMHWRAGREY
nr:FAD-binding oxidoreductase [Bradyrhizobium sp. DOA9]